MIKVLGLTGGIGTGKSTAAGFFKDKRFAHIDADQIGRDLTADGSSILPVLDELFGPEGEFGDGKTEILDENGNPITKEVPAVKSEGESSASGATEEKKEKKKTKPTEQPVNFDDL